jgi:sulfatase maturation enzyme AslB (radical SAM superfamily)
LRKGGSFERIQSNLSFLSSLKQRGLLKFFSLSFVIQDLNKWELPLLAEFAAQLKVDFVMFYKVTQWMDDESFKKIQLSPTFFSENMGLIAETKRILKENGIPYATSIPELVPV